MRPTLFPYLFPTCGLDASHHLLLGDEMINSLQQTQQALHVVAPFVQNIISISWLGKADNLCGTINLGVDCLGGDKLADVLLSLILGEIEELSEALHLDASVILGDDTDIVLNNPLSQVLPSLMRLLIA